MSSRNVGTNKHFRQQGQRCNTRRTRDRKVRAPPGPEAPMAHSTKASVGDFHRHGSCLRRIARRRGFRPSGTPVVEAHRFVEKMIRMVTDAVAGVPWVRLAEEVLASELVVLVASLARYVLDVARRNGPVLQDLKW